jgi:predicted patatin/cPLA2 family phospholipase
MADNPSLEDRVAALEKEIAELKTLVSQLTPKERSWKDVVGSMKDLPEFEEVLRLGREFRQSYRDPFDEE